MIGMMYLVLTAMLALNVSTDILKAFELVDKSLHTTMETTEARNKSILHDFQPGEKRSVVRENARVDGAV